jgi:hypothetical protein
MRRKGQVSVYFALFIIIIVALVLIQATASNQQSLTAKSTITNETYFLNTTGCINATAGGEINGTGVDADCNITVAGAPPSWRSSDCALSSVVVHNITGTGSGTGLFVEDTDYYLFEQTGIVQMINGSVATRGGHANRTMITYAYCGDGYIEDGGSRSLAGQIVLFTSIALLIVVAGIVMKNKWWND